MTIRPGILDEVRLANFEVRLLDQMLAAALARNASPQVVERIRQNLATARKTAHAKFAAAMTEADREPLRPQR